MVDFRGHRGMAIAAGCLIVVSLTGCSSSFRGGDQEAFCSQLEEQASPEAVRRLAAQLGPDSTADEWEEALDEAGDQLGELQAKAPRELRSSLESLKASNAAMRSLYAAADYDPMKVDPAALEAVTKDPSYLAATAALGTYAKGTCGIALTNPAG